MADYIIVKKCDTKPVKRKSWKVRLLKVSIILALIFALLLGYYYGRIAPVVIAVIEEKYRMQISKSIDDSVSQYVTAMTYDDYVIVKTDSDGNVSYIGVNSVTMNIFARKVTDLVRTKMSAFEDTGVTVPFGAFTGIAFMSNVGPDLNINALSLNIVDANFTSTFTDAGINQTLHRMYVIVEVNGKVILPGYARELSNSSQILVCESVIVGKTPNTYIDV